MSEGSTPEERTEAPTERRMGQLRREGAIPLSNDVVQLATLTAGFLLLGIMWSSLYHNMKLVMIKSINLMAYSEEMTVDQLYAGFIGLIIMMGPDIAIITLSVATVATFAVMLQTKWNVKEKKIKFDLSFLNPIGGLKKIISIQGLISTLKGMLKLGIILPIGYSSLKTFAPKMLPLVHMSVEQVMSFSAAAIVAIFWKVFWILLGFALFDYFWTNHQWLKNNRMTKEEVKDERKSIEGDEATKRKIIAKGLQRIARRIRQSVPKATVVITNPTHISVALQYDRATMPAPIVVAKGRGYLALRIREIAKEHGVPVIERKPVARALYKSTEVGAVIPRELFKAVAEILAYVYKLKNPYRSLIQQQQPEQAEVRQ